MGVATSTSIVVTPGGGPRTGNTKGSVGLGGRRGRCFFGIGEAIIVIVRIGIVPNPVAISIQEFFRISRKSIEEIDHTILIRIYLSRSWSLNHL